jgi:glycosyltransferase involved in cell wall biosynthesis
MQVVDTLQAGGMERVAVNIANALPPDQFTRYLCTTRAEGALASVVAPDVARLSLERRHTLDFRAAQTFVRFIRKHNIRILHAHGSSVFLSAFASLFAPYPAVIWHDHFGLYRIKERSHALYWLAGRRVDGVLTVNEQLSGWAREVLCMPRERVWYVPNFVCRVPAGDVPAELPGHPGRRIVCVANFRPQKDHGTLVAALALVTREIPDAHLCLVGTASDGDAEYLRHIQAEISRAGLTSNITILGPRGDVPAILRASDVGVLSSASEGFPLVLLEYGLAALPVVATRVGQCAEILNDGLAGVLVPPQAPEALAEGIVRLLRSAEQRDNAGQALRRRVMDAYSEESAIQRISKIYELVDEAGTAGAMSHPHGEFGHDAVKN